MPSLHIIFASTSGHTEYVTQVFEEYWRRSLQCKVTRTRVELAKPEDLLKGDILVLASGTWNTGGPEGQLNPHMHTFVSGCAKDVDLRGRCVAVIGLGDERYYYTARALAHLQKYVEGRGGKVIASLRIVNEPYGQEDKIQKFAQQVLKVLDRKHEHISSLS